MTEFQRMKDLSIGAGGLRHLQHALRSNAEQQTRARKTKSEMFEIRQTAAAAADVFQKGLDCCGSSSKARREDIVPRDRRREVLQPQQHGGE